MLVIEGFIMALADSVPGVSGGTVALLLGFFDRFVESLRAVASRNAQSRRASRRFLAILSVGWCLGMALAMSFLAELFDKYVYEISSLFLGFVLASIPVVAHKEKAALAGRKSAIPMALAGFLMVYLITLFSSRSAFELNISRMTLISGVVLFIAAAFAASAMILPGISGSSLLMAFGLYLPVVTQLGALVKGELSALPAVAVFGLGALTGLVFFVRLLGRALKRFRAHTIWMILGMMAASLYAVAIGPTTLGAPRAALSPSTFSLPFFLSGCALIALIALCEARKASRAAQDAR